MSNMVACPNCDVEIDATSASLTGCCPECDEPFSELLERPDDGVTPEIDYGPPEGHE